VSNDFHCTTVSHISVPQKAEIGCLELEKMGGLLYMCSNDGLLGDESSLPLASVEG
jgi:hypothetical protein